MTKSSELLQRFEADRSATNSLTNHDRHLLDADVDEMLRTIASCNGLEEADPMLEKLGHLQEILATLAFKHGVQLSSRQREIVRQYDRCDLPSVRQCVFQKIKNAEFPWCQQ